MSDDEKMSKTSEKAWERIASNLQQGWSIGGESRARAVFDHYVATMEKRRDDARAEGFAKAREMAIVEVNLEREARDEEDIPAGVVIARLRAMQDEGAHE